MNNINIEILKSVFLGNRAQSLYWRSGMMLSAGLVSIIVDSLSSFQLPTYVVVFLGLIFGEISKLINKKLQENS